jgi:hypothetical protein
MLRSSISSTFIRQSTNRQISVPSISRILLVSFIFVCEMSKVDTDQRITHSRPAHRPIVDPSHPGSPGQPQQSPHRSPPLSLPHPPSPTLSPSQPSNPMIYRSSVWTTPKSRSDGTLGRGRDCMHSSLSLRVHYADGSCAKSPYLVEGPLQVPEMFSSGYAAKTCEYLRG